MNFKIKLKTKIVPAIMCLSMVPGFVNVSAITPTELIAELVTIYKIKFNDDGTVKKYACPTDELTDKQLDRLDELSCVAVRLGIDKIIYNGYSLRDYAERWGCIYFLVNIILKAPHTTEEIPYDTTGTETDFTPPPNPNYRLRKRISCSAYDELYQLQQACGLRFDHRFAINNSDYAPVLTTKQKEILQTIVKNASRQKRINFEYCNGNTLLHYAAMFNCPYLIDLLKNAGAKMDIKGSNWQGNTPLHTACYYGNKDAIAMLIQCGALIDVQNKHGNIPLVLYTRNSGTSRDTAKLLIPHNYDGSNFANSKGETPIDIAKKYKRSGIISLLEQSAKKAEAEAEAEA
ncbi:MAG: ankyrin repeat domain-containing protein, partial [Clostridia bacterium]|nr:ankyrin repeat domain-containing protein [Clostridia bacterium]